MKHKHYDLIMAFANGADIQYRPTDDVKWRDDLNPWWNCEKMEFRIKPVDIVSYAEIHGHGHGAGHVPVYFYAAIFDRANCKATFDAETRKLKTLEMI